MTGSPVPLTVNAGSCDLNVHACSPVVESRAVNSPTEFLTTTSDASTTAFARTSPPILVSHRIS